MIDSLNEAVIQAEAAGCSLGDYALSQEAAEGLRTRGELEAGLLRALVVMRGAVARGLPGDLRSVSGLVGGDAARLNRQTGPLSGTLFTDVLASALAVQEVNAAMGVIVAAPTAGGAGVLPGVLLGLAGRQGVSDAALVRADGSKGVHNPWFARKLLESAMARANEAWASADPNHAAAKLPL
ncbi:MAG TPA: L-serine ammonia-lyase, iron-sulfur-dependent, subunit alpha, partial [Gemmatimonadales bacterium]|nr:L-serine ammonia-lyase, iron-sulfur-dependent, subunit alpha [Gemmatimonadales bacterium]